MSVFERFIEALEAEEAASRPKVRVPLPHERLEPLTITIGDQECLRRIYAIARSRPWKEKPESLVRGHLRVWARDEMDRVRRGAFR